MDKSNQAFTSGIWIVKQGKEKEFIKEWKEFAEWSRKIDNAPAHLLQDTENPARFVSVGKWNSMDAIQKWAKTTEFKDAMSRISNLLEEPSKPHVMKEVVKVGEFEVV